MYSECEGGHMCSEGESFSSSEAHSEQVTAPLRSSRKHSRLAAVAHSFSEPDLLRLVGRAVPRTHPRERGGRAVELPVILETPPD